MSEITLYCGNCLEYIHKTSVNLSSVFWLLDPPYPDYYEEDFKYQDGIIDFLEEFSCVQFVFWTAKGDFPLDYTARHVWDKMTGAACQYDFIYERNGGKRQRVFRGHRINSSVSAQFAGEEFTGHKSQKPLKVLSELIADYTKKGDTIFDPFMGSGTTGVAAVRLGRSFIGCEINPEYFAIAKRRIEEANSQLRLPMLFDSAPTSRQMNIFSEVDDETQV